MIWGREGGITHKESLQRIVGTNLEIAFPKVMYEHSAIVKAQAAAVLFLFCLRQLFSYTENSSNPAFHSAPSFLKKLLYWSLNFLCLVSARGELFWNVLFKSSQLILTFGRRGKKRGRKGIFNFKNVFILLITENLKAAAQNISDDTHF